MANLIVTFCRAAGAVMDGNPWRTEKLDIAAPSSDPVVTEMAAGSDPGSHQENIADLYAEAACWVHIAAEPDAVDPDSIVGWSKFIRAGERMQFAIRRGERVSVVAAS